MQGHMVRVFGFGFEVFRVVLIPIFENLGIYFEFNFSDLEFNLSRFLVVKFDP